MVFKMLVTTEFKRLHAFRKIVEQGRPVAGLVAEVRIKPLTGSTVGTLLFLNTLINEPGAHGRQFLFPGSFAGSVQFGLLAFSMG